MLQHIGRAVVNINRGNNVVARGQALKDGRHTRQAGTKRGTGSAAFQRRQRCFQAIAVGVVIARIKKTTRIAPVRVPLESC